MKVLLVYCHPEPHSFNSALRDTAKRFFESTYSTVVVSDLYADGFDPVEKVHHYANRAHDDRFDPLAEQRNAYRSNTLPTDVKREIDRLKACDLVIFQFPMWWHQQPAMLKGWFDRVFVAGGLYTSTVRYDTGFFRGKRALCSVTSGAPANTFSPRGRGGGDIKSLLHSLNYSLHYMGFTVLPPYLTAEVQGSGFTYKDPDAFAQSLVEKLSAWETHLKHLDSETPLSFPGWNDWTDTGAEKPIQ